MTFIWYKTANNIVSYLMSAISSTSTSIIVHDWIIFPTSFPYLLTIEQQLNGETVTREIVKATAISWDTITIQRAVEPCVSDDTANPKTYTQVAHSFEWNAIVSLNMTAWVLGDCQQWITDNAEAIDTADQEITDLIDMIQTLEDDIQNL